MVVIYILVRDINIFIKIILFSREKVELSLDI